MAEYVEDKLATMSRPFWFKLLRLNLELINFM